MDRGLRPLLVSQFLGAFNDNAWKMMVLVLLGRQIVGLSGAEEELASQQQTMMAFTIFTLPLLLFSLPAGVLADRVSKRRVITWMKGVECGLMLTGAILIVQAPTNGLLLLGVLALMGVQSALFSPAKYGILPELVPHERLSEANGQLELWTFAAIIGGTAFGPVMIGMLPPAVAGGIVVSLALVGLFSSTRIPTARPACAGARFADTLSESWRILWNDRSLRLSTIGLTWFWVIGSLLGQELIVYARTVLGLSESYAGAPFGVFGVGVGIGSILAGRLSSGKVEVGMIPLGAVGLGAATLYLGVARPDLTMTLVAMGIIGLFSGFIVVPLQSMLQWRSPEERRGAIIALSNVFVFAGMFFGSLLGYFLSLATLSVTSILTAAALATILGTLWTLWLLPDGFLRMIIFLWTHSLYRVKVIGRTHVPAQGGALLTPNHVSFVDGMFLLATTDRPIRFIVDDAQFNRPFVKPFLKVLRAIPISANGGARGLLKALRDAGEYLDQGELVCIFPEGQITRTGGLLPFRRGMERIAKGRDAPIIPVHLDRVWGSIFSYSGGRFVKKLPEELPYRVTVTYGEPLPSDTSMHDVRKQIQSLSELAWQERRHDRPCLHRTFIKTARRRPWRLAMADYAHPRVSRFAAVIGSIALARALRSRWENQARVGILLPPSVVGALTNIAASMTGRTSVNLNFTAGAAGMTSAASQAELKTVVTSRTFLEKGEIELPDGVKPIFLEEVAPEIDSGSRFYAGLLSFLPVALLERVLGRRRPARNDDPVTVIFSSGSTGEPQGVMLTHFNIDSNVEGVAQVFRAGPGDRLLGILPLFHSFGFMSTWFALNHGVPVIFHPNPLDAPVIGHLVERYGITLMLATPTFLSIYTRRCSPGQFGSLRVVLAGAEKLTDRVADAFEETFGIRPLEGYGATECSPVVTACTPSFRAAGFYQPGSRRGSVGAPLPGVALEVVDPDTLEVLPNGQPGMLRVKGPNVMKGYLGRHDLTEKVLQDGWYTTGDIAVIDEDGFVRITDRLSRFSKIGGEMVPHGKVEEALHQAEGSSSDQRFAVTSVKDEKKGERLAVITTVDLEEVPGLLEKLSAAGLPNLFIPRRDSFVKVDALPLLGTGKIDLKGLKAIAAATLDPPQT